MVIMDGKKIFFIFMISTLLIGGAFAAKSVNDFKVNDTYNMYSATIIIQLISMINKIQELQFIKM